MKGVTIMSEVSEVKGATVTTLVHDAWALAPYADEWDEADEAMFDAIIAELRVRDEWHRQADILDYLTKKKDRQYMEKYVRSSQPGHKNLGK